MRQYILSAALPLTWTSAALAVPSAVPFIGRLSHDSGIPYNGGGTLEMTLSLHPGSLSPQTIWGPYSLASVPIFDGFFSVLLGDADTGPLGDSLLSTPELWLEVAVNGQTLAPRLRIVSVPYSLVSGKALAVGDLPADQVVSFADLGSAAISNSYEDLDGKPSIAGSAGALAAFGSQANALVESVVREVSGQVGIGTNTPQARLDVNGGVRLGYTATCTAASEGTLRYDATSKLVEVCTGTSWVAVSGGGGTTCLGYPAAACIIDGACVGEGMFDPVDACQVCAPEETADAWSPAACGAGQVCVPPTGCCTQVAIGSGPANASTSPGGNASFSVSLSAGTATSYAWSRSTDGGGSWSPLANGSGISGAATPTLSLSGLTTGANGHKFRVAIGGNCGEVVTSAAATLTVAIAGKRVFVTSTTYNGNLGGTAGADAKCQARAAAAGFSGTFKAWISAGTAASSPSTRFTKASIPYVRVDGAIIANNWADLTDGTIQNPIWITELGTSTTSNFVYSFTRTDGTQGLFNNSSSNCYGADCHCAGWTTTAIEGSPTPGSAVAQTYATNDDWTDYSFGNFCGGSFPLYCFEQ